MASKCAVNRRTESAAEEVEQLAYDVALKLLHEGHDAEDAEVVLEEHGIDVHAFRTEILNGIWSAREFEAEATYCAAFGGNGEQWSAAKAYASWEAPAHVTRLISAGRVDLRPAASLRLLGAARMRGTSRARRSRVVRRSRATAPSGDDPGGGEPEPHPVARCIGGAA